MREFDKYLSRLWTHPKLPFLCVCLGDLWIQCSGTMNKNLKVCYFQQKLCVFIVHSFTIILLLNESNIHFIKKYKTYLQYCGKQWIMSLNILKMWARRNCHCEKKVFTNGVEAWRERAILWIDTLGHNRY